MTTPKATASENPPNASNGVTAMSVRRGRSWGTIDRMGPMSQYALTTPVIASGGITSLADLAALKAVEESGIVGAIAGRALYDGRLQPHAALALLAE